MNRKKIVTTLVYGGSALTIMGSEAYERFHRDQLMPHNENQVERPKDLGKYSIIAAVTTMAPLTINVSDTVPVSS